MTWSDTSLATRYSLTIFFNVDRADQLDCRRWRDNIKKVVRETLRADQQQNQKQYDQHVLSAEINKNDLRA
jgi:hypothetical protein